MRVLTTAINKGEHKVPEGHKCMVYALAPGDALEMNDAARETTVRAVDAKTAKIAKYLYTLRWAEGRTVAEFDVNGKIYVQPTQDDPKPKKARRQRAEDDDVGVHLSDGGRARALADAGDRDDGEAARPETHPRRAQRKRKVPALQVDQPVSGVPRRRVKRRRPMKPLVL